MHFTNPPGMDPDVDIGQAESGRYDYGFGINNIRRIWIN
jgi:hypothetical protein